MARQHDSIPRDAMRKLAAAEDKGARALSGKALERYDDGISMRDSASSTPAARGVDAKSHNVN